MAINYSKLLTHDDYEFLSAKYDIEVDAIQVFSDEEWCDFLECSRADLAYLLFGDESYVEPSIDEPTLEELLAMEAEADDFYLADSIPTLFDDEEYASLFGEVVSLERVRNERLSGGGSSSKKSSLKASVKRHPANTSPSWEWSRSAKAKPNKVVHFFKLVN